MYMLVLSVSFEVPWNNKPWMAGICVHLSSWKRYPLIHLLILHFNNGYAKYQVNLSYASICYTVIKLVKARIMI